MASSASVPVRRRDQRMMGSEAGPPDVWGTEGSGVSEIFAEDSMRYLEKVSEENPTGEDWLRHDRWFSCFISLHVAVLLLQSLLHVYTWASSQSGSHCGQQQTVTYVSMRRLDEA